jgi:hypothetical protein
MKCNVVCCKNDLHICSKCKYENDLHSENCKNCVIVCCFEPKIESEENWMLCSIVSPKEEENVLLTFKNESGTYVGEATLKKNTYYYVAETNNGYFEEQYEIPIAWMQIPEPYRV